MKRKLVVGACIAALGVALSPLTLFAAEGAPREQITAKDIKDAKPTATVEVEAEQLRLFIGGGTGKGVLRFQGKSYPFTIKAGTLGGVGATKVHAVGDVYFLQKVEDFAGRYSAGTSGIAVGKGVSASSYQNDKGVYVSLRAKTEGVGLSLGISTAVIELQKN